MKIKKIKLENFRHYYGEQEVNFSTDENKNLTLILAKNNGGKTTLAQSIIWCLYGTTTLNEPKEILNKDVKLRMEDGETRKTSVTLELIHKGKLYIIRREQEYKKLSTRFSEEESKQTIMSYNSNNVLINVSDTNINEILPESLSRFFIFDGERMLNLGTNNSLHREHLKKDIRTILGLDILEEAIHHLGGRGNNNGGVLLSLNNKLDNNNDSEIVEAKEEIKRINETIEKLQEELDLNKNLELEYQNELTKLSEFLEESKPISEKQIERKNLENEVNDLKERKEKLKKQTLKKFSGSFSYLLLQKLFEKNIKFVAESSDLEEATPDVTSRTIDYILDKEECICGTTFNKNDSIYNKLNTSKRFYPPESIGTTTKRYLDTIKSIAKNNEETKVDLEESFEDYFELDAAIYIKTSQLEAISRGISESSEESIQKAEERYQELKDALEDLKESKDELEADYKYQLKAQKEQQDKLDELSDKSEKNKKIKNYREVTKEVLNQIKKVYLEEENKVRKELQREVQKVYSEINRGKGKIEINEKYFDFELYTESNGQLVKDNSKGQGLSTVAAFAFVCGITKLVRDKKMAEEFNNENEPYPLIIDAPFSVMDTDYIQKVSKIVPEYAEQLVIMVKDDNYKVAKDVFEDSGIIGKEYSIELERNDDGTEYQFKTFINPISETKVGAKNV